MQVGFGFALQNPLALQSALSPFFPSMLHLKGPLSAGLTNSSFSKSLVMGSVSLTPGSAN